jgi:uncharacterized protein YndB with AHSA1/START domain
MIEPIDLEFTVDAEVDHAFEMWTGRAALWWPRGHTITKENDLTIAFEPRPGGRIYERGGDGSEHDWGEIVEWDPPHSLTYLWFLFFDRLEATTVQVTFSPTRSGTSVRIFQSGFERLGEPGQERRTRTAMAWATIGAHYASAIRT